MLNIHAQGEARERVLALYSLGRNSGRPDWMAQALQAASDDPELELMLLELSDAYIAAEEPVYAAAPAPLVSILTEASRVVALDIRQLASKLQLDVPIVRKLDQRLIDPRSVPESLVRRIADTLRRQADEIVSYLSLPPTLAQGAMYKSRTMPTAQQQQSFAQALRTSPSLSAEDRDYWLSETKPPGGSA